MDILKSYGLLLNKDWSSKLNGYFMMNWSHLWLPYKGKPNKIKVEQEQYMKMVAMNLNEANEVVLFHNSILGNYYFDTDYEVISNEVSCMVESYK